ncbi:DNA repair protein RecO [Fluviibacterium sp. S390]|uniref:DNA repair protein RecO n=1 Tax=Fluviibacterium sp. S390 TaxID=3415139 RepID=UPI003C7B6754
MDWRDEGVLLTMRRHGESAAIIEVLTEAHGRHAGIVRGGAGRRMAPVLQPGAQVSVAWRARLEDHLGAFTVEPLRSRMPGIMGDRLALAGLNAVCGLLAVALPEREAVPGIYDRSRTLLDLMPITEAWPLAYLHWELALLEALGFGLDLSVCAVTGATGGLAYVSPRSGRAVTAKGAGDWADKLLPLPPCMLPGGDGDNAQIAQALATTGYFWSQHLTPRGPKPPLPAARQRLLDLLARV